MRPKFHVEITRQAQLDLQAIQDFIALDSPRRAEGFVGQLAEKILDLEEMPMRAPLCPEKILARQGLRHLVLDPYRVIFRVEGSKVWVLRAIHGARLLRKRPF